MKTPKKYMRHLKRHEITLEMLASCVCSYEKRYNYYRDLERVYRIKGNETALEKARHKKQKCSAARDILLRVIKPIFICRVYEEDWKVDQRTGSSYYDDVPKYYLYYVFGGHVFFIPIKEESLKLYDLEIWDTLYVNRKCVSEKELLSVQFCEKLFQESISGKCKYLP